MKTKTLTTDDRPFWEFALSRRHPRYGVWLRGLIPLINDSIGCMKNLQKLQTQQRMAKLYGT